MNVVGRVDVESERAKKARKWEEIERLGKLSAESSGERRLFFAAELLAELGALSNTPRRKQEWINDRWDGTDYET